MDDNKIMLRICANLRVDTEMGAAIVRLLKAYADKYEMKQIDQDSTGVFRYVKGEERLTWIV